MIHSSGFDLDFDQIQYVEVDKPLDVLIVVFGLLFQLGYISEIVPYSAV